MMGQVFLKNLKAINFLYKNDSDIEEKIFSVMEKIYYEIAAEEKKEETINRFSYKFKNKYYKLDYSQIQIIETNPLKRCLAIHIENEVLPCQYKLNVIMENLPNNFVRIHRAIIVNIDKVDKISATDGLYLAVMENGRVQPISKTYVEYVIERFQVR